jgi:hypothetical protein
VTHQPNPCAGARPRAAGASRHFLGATSIVAHDNLFSRARNGIRGLRRDSGSNVHTGCATVLANARARGGATCPGPGEASVAGKEVTWSTRNGGNDS